VSSAPVLIFLAGPNGSGKSTFFDAYLAHLGLAYVNADRIASALRAADATASQDQIDRRAFSAAEGLRASFVAARMSFCTETVFSDPIGAKLELLAEARTRGLAIVLIFIGLDSPELSVTRVMQRVAQGGHDIPDQKLYARYPRVLANLRAAIPVVDEAFLFDNSSFDEPYRLVARYAQGKLVSQHPPLPPWTHGLPGL
jgi:predicted ABC-type ATPase